MPKKTKPKFQQNHDIKMLFPGHYRPGEDAFKKLWEKGVFVPDSNVLLNLYRYPERARKDFLNVLNKVKERIWVPHQVILEFQRNRLGVITSTLRPVKELTDEIKSMEIQVSKIKEQINTNQKRAILGAVDHTIFEEKINEGTNKFNKPIRTLAEHSIGVF